MADDLIPNQILGILAIFGGLLSIYLSSITIIGGVLSIIAVVLSTLFGANTLRKIGKYSLGTGIPSIVYLLTSVAMLSFILSLALSIQLKQAILFPVMALIIATILSAIISLVCRYVFKIQVEILSKSFISITLASAITITAMSTLVSQSYNPTVIYESIIKNGIVILLMILSVMIIQNPYNSCMGPNEDQIRTLTLTLSNSFLMMMIVSVISIITTEYWIIYLVLSLIGWFISFRKYILYTKHQAASIKKYGLWPKDDGEN